MNKSLKTFIFEDRKADVIYTEKKARNIIEKVTAELKDHDASVMSKIARRFDRLNTAVKLMGEKKKELNKDLKVRVEDLFNAEDAFLTRVIDTASFTLTLAKVSKEPPGEKVVVDWKSIAEKLAELIPKELEAQAEEIRKAYTAVNIMDVPEPALRVVNKNAKAAADAVKLEEGIVDKLSALISKSYNKIKNWSKSYDKKLQSLMATLAGEITESLNESINFNDVVAKFTVAVRGYIKSYPDFKEDNAALRKTLTLFKAKKFPEALAEIEKADSIVKDQVPSLAWTIMNAFDKREFEKSIPEFEKNIAAYKKSYTGFDADHKALENTLEYYKAKKFKKAFDTISAADTIVRDSLPSLVWKILIKNANLLS